MIVLQFRELPMAFRYAPLRIALALGLSVLICGECASQMRQLVGKHVTINTDLPSSELLAQLPAAFDAAVPQWCAFFRVDSQRLAQWHVTAYLMSSKEAFQQRGLIPDHLPDFAHGYQWGDSIWVVNQPSDYYTRHLLLHEGVHAMMSKVFGAAGPAWFMEGTAELLATHTWNNGKLQSAAMPASREAFPFWGRLKVIEQARSNKQALSIDAVMRYSQKAHRQVEPYAWSWAALLLLEMYPEYRSVVVEAAARGTDPPNQFTHAFYNQMKDQWPALQMRWLMLIDGIDYGFDRQRNRIEIVTHSPSSVTKTFAIVADRGWQSTGIRVAQGQTIQISAEGQYTLGNTPRSWTCQPQGITMDYHRGRPLGMMLAAIAPDSDRGAKHVRLPQIVGIGTSRTLIADFDGLLLLRIGDDPGSLADNTGMANVIVNAQGNR